MIEATIAPFSFSPRIEIVDTSRFDVRAYGAIGNGVDNDTVPIQAAMRAARDWIRATLAPGNVPAIHRTGTSWASTVYFPPGLYAVDRPIVVYPHTSLEGAGWGRSAIKLTASGWAQSAPPMDTNPQGIMWIGPTGRPSALLWLQGDEEWPVASGLKVAGMVNSITHLGLKCPDGAAIFSAGNQNHIAIQHCWINGWGDGPTGLGIVSNNATSSTQITNLFLDHNMIEGCRAAIVLDRVVIGSIKDNQIESCGNGIYVGSAESQHTDCNLLTCTIPQKPFENGIWIGCGYPCSISHNTIHGVTKKAIKLLGRSTTVSGNRILVKNGAAINESGYRIHIVTPARQFGGDTSVLRGQHGPHTITGNTIDCDVWPVAKPLPGFPAPEPLKAIWPQEAPGEKLIVRLSDNVDGPNVN